MEASFAVLVAAIAAVVGIAGWMLLGSHSRHRRLERLRDERDAAQAEARCVAAFPSVDPLSAHAAYRWVQELVEIEALPLHPDDDLQALLGMDPRAIDDKFDTSREFAGPARGALDVPRPLRTVRALMAAVLAAGCELASSDPA
ncbi:MAG: hypothetical protein JF586_09045 [Burkholderiales bacterium]|jgi:hypothetical protein|nr:hypothetical protein [Burkholderiales bacterium]